MGLVVFGSGRPGSEGSPDRDPYPDANGDVADRDPDRGPDPGTDGDVGRLAESLVVHASNLRISRVGRLPHWPPKDSGTLDAPSVRSRVEEE